MSSTTDALVPFFKWAENGSHIFLTIEVTDCEHTKVDFANDTVIFHGNGKDNKKYELSLKLKKTIDPKTSSYVAHGREVEVAIVKAEDSQGWWNTLLADKNAYKNRIKIDWDKWTDEDESNESKVPSGFGGMGGLDMGGAGGMDFSKMMGNMNDDDDGEADEPDSDDEPLPELESNPPKDAKDESALKSDSSKSDQEKNRRTGSINCSASRCAMS